MAVRLESMPRSGILPGVQRAVNAYRDQSATLNAFGRTYGEAISEFSDFIQSISLQTTGPRNATPSPSLIDSDSSPPSSPDWSLAFSTHAISPKISPPASPAGSSMSKTVHEISILMQSEEDLISATEAMDIQADHFPVMQDTGIQEEDLLALIVPGIAVQEAEVAMPTPWTLSPAPVPQVSILMGTATSMQQLLDAVTAAPRAPTPPESLELSPDIVVVGPPGDEDGENVAAPAPRATLLPDCEASLSPHHGRQKTSRVDGRFRCSQCPNTAPKTFTRLFDMKRHIENVHQGRTLEGRLALTCPCCYEELSRTDSFRRHVFKVPASCMRYSKLKGKSPPPPQPESLYELCRAGNPPLPDRMPNSLKL
ncbi:hypothetical protein HYPSUDRAFT_33396 [Hypholoma sublateritium FD-334 SS-4]|uniref:C2H2-type domain-containing protein n=1 Tax=Hypholoma sublateritium (strain FD-334 SS-4) TaxID=945553 RepID=A0A0D2MXV9_HYPSF|nr:hypothetical protein HYPSUDRAFT_33396 [Hypholoma sublateritium FD-334 SS-4]